jgi:hypothetical protein
MLSSFFLGVVAALSMQPHVDSVFVGRVVKEAPHHITKKKEGVLTSGAMFSVLVERLLVNGYFDLPSATVTAACGDPNANVNRWVIRVHADGTWRELIIRDDCDPSSESLQSQLTAFRRTASDIIAGHIRPLPPPRG